MAPPKSHSAYGSACPPFRPDPRGGCAFLKGSERPCVNSRRPTSCRTTPIVENLWICESEAGRLELLSTAGQKNKGPQHRGQGAQEPRRGRSGPDSKQVLVIDDELVSMEPVCDVPALYPMATEARLPEISEPCGNRSPGIAGKGFELCGGSPLPAFKGIPYALVLVG